MFESFKRGQTYSYQVINDEIGYASHKKLQKAILEIPVPEKHSVMLRVKEDIDYYEDDFDPESDILHYIGQGKPEQGHQHPVDGNKRIIQNENSNFYLFVQPRGRSGWWTYHGIWKLLAINPSYESNQMISEWERQLVYRFTFVRKDTEAEKKILSERVGNISPTRYDATTSRIERDTDLSHRLKSLHNHRCQICSKTIETPKGTRHCEAHHIKPLGRPHNGPDVGTNMIVLCPNHHAEMERSAFYISWPDMKIHHFDHLNPYHGRRVRRHEKHRIGAEYLEYHKEVICRSWSE